MATRAEVAKRAGVSPAVVSYVINGGPRRVAPETAARVRQAIADLHYTPNAIARSLRTAKSSAFGLIVPDVSNAFFAQLAREIEVAAFAADATLLLGNAMDDAEREYRYIQAFVERRVDGLIVAPTGRNLMSVEALQAAQMPVVVVDRDMPNNVGSTVVVDNNHGGYLATRHLLEHGHERVAIIAGPDDAMSAVERHRGWAQAMSEAGRPVDGLAVHVPFSRSAAHAAALELFDRPDRVSAVFLSSDEHALGVYRALTELGLRIPDDVAVASFDSSDGAPYFVPALTAVHQPTAQIAARVLEVLKEHAGDPDRFPTRDILPVQLVVRRSCGCPDSPSTSRA
jgi:LacI family transcriptional regulator